LRKKPPNRKFLYVISPQEIFNTNKFLFNLRQVLSSGIVNFFQLRIKSNEKKKIIDLAKKIKTITKRYKVKFIINDSPFIAKVSDAEGWHLGRSDPSFNFGRKILGKKKIIGATCNNLKYYSKNISKFVDYIAYGAFYKTTTHKTKYRANIKLLRWAKKNIKKPIVAIGGINQSNYKILLENGADYIAVVSCIWDLKNYSPLKAVNMFKK